MASRTYVPCSLLELMGDLGAKGVLDQDLRSSNEPSWVRAQTSGKERPPPLAFPFVAPAGGRVQVRPQHKLHPTARAASRWDVVQVGSAPGADWNSHRTRPQGKHKDVSACPLLRSVVDTRACEQLRKG